MITLNTTTKLEIVLGSVPSSELEYSVTYIDEFNDTVGSTKGLTNGTTDVTLVAAPSSETRLIRYVNVYNPNAGSILVTIKVDVSATEKILIKKGLGAGDTLIYDSQRGWYIAFLDVGAYTDADAIDAINNDGTHGSTATHTLDDLTDTNILSPTDGQLLEYNTSTGKWIASSSGAVDNRVAVDAGAVPGFLGITGITGVLRVDTSLDYVDGGDFVTLSLDSTLKSNYDSAYLHISNDGSDHGFIDQNVTILGDPSFLTLTLTTSTGTAPLTISSQTLVANLNSDQVDGADLSIDTNLGTSDILIPSQNAVKTYVDNAITAEDFWDRVGGALYPKNSGDDIIKSSTGDIGSPSIRWDNIYGITIDGTTITDGTFSVTGGAITGATNTNWDLAYAHITSDGSSHGFINQDVTTTGDPTFNTLVLNTSTGTAPLTISSITLVTNLSLTQRAEHLILIHLHPP